MKSTKKRIYPHLIKRKLIAFLLFFGLSLIIFFISLYVRNIPAIISFILVCVLYSIRNYSNFIYLSFMYKISNLADKDFIEEVQGFNFLAYIAFPIIFLSGIMMSILIRSPNYNSGYIQIFMLFCLLIIFNEFYLVFKIGKFVNKIAKNEKIDIKDIHPIEFITIVLVENIGAIYGLVVISNQTLLNPYNYLAHLIIVAMVVSMIILFKDLLKNVQHED